MVINVPINTNNTNLSVAQTSFGQTWHKLILQLYELVILQSIISIYQLH